MWNLRDKTRLWGQACGEIVFTDFSNLERRTDTFVQPDNTIRPFSDKSKCFYHKVNGFTENEKIYVSDCVDHDRYRWNFDVESGKIINWNRKWIIPHCITIPEYTNSAKKQQLFLAPCEDDNLNQVWKLENGMIKPRENSDVCIMWNLKDKTRLWATSCGEYRFSEFK